MDGRVSGERWVFVMGWEVGVTGMIEATGAMMGGSHAPSLRTAILPCLRIHFANLGSVFSV